MEELKKIVSKFEIGDPIKSLFRPEFHVDYDFYHGSDKVEITLSISAPSATKPGDVIKVSVRKELPRNLCHADVYEKKSYERLVSDFLRDMLKFIIIHEVDESIKFAGERVYDPHNRLVKID